MATEFKSLPFWAKREALTKALAKRYAKTKAGSEKNMRLASALEYLRKRPFVMVERVNLMSGKTYMEAAGTPGYLSPASEAYWSM